MVIDEYHQYEYLSTYNEQSGVEHERESRVAGDLRDEGVILLWLWSMGVHVVHLVWFAVGILR
jgi:hypothetical protein